MTRRSTQHSSPNRDRPIHPELAGFVEQRLTEQQAAIAQKAKAIETGHIDARTASVEQVVDRLRDLGLDADAIGGGLRPVEPVRPGAQTGPTDELAQLRGFQLAATSSVEAHLAAGEPVNARRMTVFEVEALRRAHGLDPS